MAWGTLAPLMWHSRQVSHDEFERSKELVKDPLMRDRNRETDGGAKGSKERRRSLCGLTKCAWLAGIAPRLEVALLS